MSFSTCAQFPTRAFISRRSRALLYDERAKLAFSVSGRSYWDPKVQAALYWHTFWSQTQINFQMLINLVWLSILDRGLQTHGHRWADCTVSIGKKCSSGSRDWIVLHVFSDYFENLAPKSQSQNTFKYPYCRLIFNFQDWKPKQKPRSDFFFLGIHS